MFSVIFLNFKNMIPFYTYALLVKYFKIMSSFFVKLFGEKKFVNSINVFPLNIKSINPIQKYSHITESFACILICMLVFLYSLMFLFLINVLIAFGICSTPKESKQVILFLFTCKATQWVPISEYSSRFNIYAPSFIFCKLSREKTPLNLGSFW